MVIDMSINWQQIINLIEKTPLMDLLNTHREIIKEKEEKRKAERIVRHGDALYITLKDDPDNTWYCAICYGNNGKFIPVDKSNPGSIYCPMCKNSSWYDREKAFEDYEQQDQTLNNFLNYNGYKR